MSTVCAYQRVGYSPSNRAFRESTGQRQANLVGIGSPHTLKLLLAVSILLDRRVEKSAKVYVGKQTMEGDTIRTSRERVRWLKTRICFLDQ